MKKIDAFYLPALLLLLGAAIVFSVPGLIPFADQTVGMLVRETVSRIAAACFLLLLMVRFRRTAVLGTRWRGKDFLWAIPCLAVALANFPYSALITGSATVGRPALVPLFLLKCAAIALFEELFFRGILLSALWEHGGRFRLLSVLLSSAFFALMHLVNLFYGAGIGATLLQVGYTFLLGCMLAVTVLKTHNLWLCMFLHFLFDIGGMLVSDLGAGAVHDVAFWVLTAAAGVLCAAHIIGTAIKLTKRDNAAQ